MDRLIRSVAAVALALLVGGCRDHPPHVVGKVHVVVGDRVRSPQLRACLRRYPELRLATGTRVERSGPLGDSLTIAVRRSPLLYACDLRPGGRTVCGGAVGVWRGGRLNDPRLDIGCTGPGGRPLGAAWIVPLPRARSVAVREDGGTDVYATAAGLPVRIWTHRVDVARSSAVFDASQRAEDGTQLTHERLRAFVAG